MDIHKSMLGEDLTDSVPPRAYPLCNFAGLFGKKLTMTLAVRPPCSKALSGLEREGDFGIRIHRLVGLTRPSPERLKVKPPHLSSLVEGEIVKRTLAFFRSAGNKLLIIETLSATKDSRPS
jgi:hypothetical protein